MEKEKNEFDLASAIIIVVIIVSALIYFSSSKIQNQPTKQYDPINSNSQNLKTYYAISDINIRKCASLSCDVMGQYPLNTELTLSYNSLSEMPEWVEISWIVNEVTMRGYINKKVLSESRTKIVEKIIEKQPSSLASIIKYWRPRVAYIQCAWQYSDTKEVYLQAFGSGLAMKYSDGTTAILTNKHVLTDDNGFGPNICFVKLLDNNSVYEVTTSNITWASGTTDSGNLIITVPDLYLKNIVGQNLNHCKQKASIGDSVVVLGYPSYGTDYLDITATEGIISGYDGEYYTTSAKIEHGNSGGVAILEKDNCYLGIPTGVKLGEFESLGRILDVKYIFK